ncbi:MAG: hypothetical protein ACXVD8_10180, partial [Actinomycetota bacterium]
MPTKNPATVRLVAGFALAKWAWVELNYRPHAYQAASYEHELGSEVPTNLPFTTSLLSISRILEHPAHFREHFAHANGHHNGHHSLAIDILSLRDAIQVRA